MSEKMSAEDLVKDIDTCFSAFDNIIHKYGIEKNKTIGDAYLCAGGLPNANTSHADEVVKTALDIRDFMTKYNKEKLTQSELPFEMRMSIHADSITTSIVGVKKFTYDISGDTVNVENSMESYGEGGKVKISEGNYELIKAKCNCTPRGKVMVKSKIEIDMYFVERSKIACL
ncbi:MAG: adenylate/guanylate cyclase domain-containing protein [Bacteroidetes bacterium]|nr:adenylate/guanylate cyclase domain-containing protein [Bacteroidota bacterium]